MIEPSQWPKWAKNPSVAARITGVHRSTLYEHKAVGCAAFKASGKVQLHQYREWLSKQGRKVAEPKSLLDARLKLLLAQIARVERANSVAARELVNAGEAAALVGQMCVKARAILFSRLVDELPCRLAGLAAEAIRVETRKLFDEIMELLAVPDFGDVESNTG